ncbi:hypothetical protein niasHT_030551 [Heterodera trifolii]|uniref:Uncharacterized protein n=1 Tax=Heterodera trifolii TaxID=157864 RepID=A0ABD2IRB6_9BILA
MFKILFFFISLFIVPIIADYKPSCKCPEKEQPGQLSCWGCESSCEQPRIDVCLAKGPCDCSCDCLPGFVRDKKTKKCVPKEKCSY